MDRILIVFTMYLYAVKSLAGPFQISVTNYGTTNATIRSQIDAAFILVENEVNKELPDADATSYTLGMSNASVMASKGLGIDYASNIDLAVIGAGLGVGVDAGGTTLSQITAGDVDADQFRGVGATAGIMGGLNLGMFPLPMIGPINLELINFYFHIMSLDLGEMLGGGDPSEFSYDLKAKSMGFHFQYHLMEGRTFLPAGLARWGGLYLSTGYEMTSLKGRLTTKLFNETKEVEVDGVTGNATYQGRGIIDLDITTHSIPIELTTNFQLAYFLTFFGGIGADINFGGTSVSTGFIDSAVSLDVAGQTAQAVASLDLGKEGGPDTLMLRTFGGIQFNILLAKIYLQFNKKVGEGLYGINAGLRVAY